ncbi:MAG: single-stranded DNA-binding protein [Euryarchaeota archaeon]|nr:single-stranded DNA-binding protein [Euryarchaeota archaeon]
MSENTVTFVGRLTRDPDLKFLSSGKANAKFSIAVEKRWRNAQTGEWDKRTSFFDVVCWEHLAEHVGASLHKGHRVIVSGTLEQRTWETDSGDKRSAVEVIADAVGPDLRFVTATLAQPKDTQPAFDDEDKF